VRLLEPPHDPSIAVDMTHQNILVLGASGFVGRSVVEMLVARGCRVCVPTRRLAVQTTSH